MSKVAGIEFLKERLIAVESERKQLDAEVQAINLLLAKHAGEKHRPSTSISPQRIRSGGSATPALSISKLIIRALTEAEKPQTSAQLLAFLASHGKVTGGNILRSTIHQSKLVKSVTPGVYGLVEWQH